MAFRPVGKTEVYFGDHKIGECNELTIEQIEAAPIVNEPQCNCCVGLQFTSLTVTIEGYPPAFYVNTGLLEDIAERPLRAVTRNRGDVI